MMTNKKRVQGLLRKAFGYSNLARYSHQDYVALRLEMAKLGPEDLQELLPLVLDDLLDTHTDNDINSEDSEYVIMMLDVDVTYSSERERSDTELFGEKQVAQHKSSNEYLRQLKSRDYILFTTTQCNAVYEWLLLARTWGDFTDYKDEIEGAIAYWRTRISQDNE